MVGGRRSTPVFILVTTALAGCLAETPDAPDDAGDLLGTLPNFSPLCKKAEGRFDAAGRVLDLCNVAAAMGPKPVNEPSIAVDPKDPKHLVAGGNDYNLGNTVWTGVYVSRNGGQSWTQSWIPGYPGDPRVSGLTGQTAAGDAAIAFAPDGTVYYAGIAFKRIGESESVSGIAGTNPAASVTYFEGPTLFIARSLDGGDTWDNVATPSLGAGPLVVATNPVMPVGATATIFNDKEFIAVGPDGTVYVTWTWYKFFSGTIDEGPIYLIKSVDKGKTWSDPVKLSRTTWNQGSVPAVTPDGTVAVTWGEFGGDTDESGLMNVVVRTSKDKGATWSEPVVVAEAKPVEAKHRHRVNSFPVIAADPASSLHAGRLSVVWTSNETGDGDVFASHSHDGGKTWVEPVRVNQDLAQNNASQYFAWITAGPDDALHITWLDSRVDPRNHYLEAYVASSFDGKNWSEQIVTDAPFLVDADGFTDANFMGDYLAIAASDDTVYPIWPDARTARDEKGDTDLYVARLARVVISDDG